MLLESGSAKMDLGMFFPGYNTTYSWSDVGVVVECQLRGRREQDRANKKLKRAAELVFAHQFCLFVWGLSVYSAGEVHDRRYFFKIHLYTRSRIFYSSEHDLAGSFDDFCKLLVGFALVKPYEHGWYLTPRSLSEPFIYPCGPG
jgi:hypothetical protein